MLYLEQHMWSSSITVLVRIHISFYFIVQYISKSTSTCTEKVLEHLLFCTCLFTDYKTYKRSWCLTRYISIDIWDPPNMMYESDFIFICVSMDLQFIIWNSLGSLLHIFFEENIYLVTSTPLISRIITRIFEYCSHLHSEYEHHVGLLLTGDTSTNFISSLWASESRCENQNLVLKQGVSCSSMYESLLDIWM